MKKKKYDGRGAMECEQLDWVELSRKLEAEKDQSSVIVNETISQIVSEDLKVDTSDPFGVKAAMDSFYAFERKPSEDGGESASHQKKVISSSSEKKKSSSVSSEKKNGRSVSSDKKTGKSSSSEKKTQKSASSGKKTPKSASSVKKNGNPVSSEKKPQKSASPEKKNGKPVSSEKKTQKSLSSGKKPQSKAPSVKKSQKEAVDIPVKGNARTPADDSFRYEKGLEKYRKMGILPTKKNGPSEFRKKSANWKMEEDIPKEVLSEETSNNTPAVKWFAYAMVAIILLTSVTATTVYADYLGEQNKEAAIASLPSFEDDPSLIAHNEENVLTEDVELEDAALAMPDPENKMLSLVLTSVEKDLKVKLVDEEDTLVKGLKWGITVTDEDDNESSYEDEDEDGIIHLTDISAGDYSVAITESDSLDGYVYPTIGQRVSVKAKVEYKVIANIRDEIKKESEVDAAAEDNGNRAADVETGTAPEDTVEFVESTVTEDGEIFEEARVDLSKTELIASLRDRLVGALRSLADSAATLYRSGTALINISSGGRMVAEEEVASPVGVENTGDASATAEEQKNAGETAAPAPAAATPAVTDGNTAAEGEQSVTDVKEETKEESKEEAKEETNEETKEETKEEEKEEAKEEVKEESEEEAKEESGEESLTPIEEIVPSEEENDEDEDEEEAEEEAEEEEEETEEDEEEDEDDTEEEELPPWRRTTPTPVPSELPEPEPAPDTMPDITDTSTFKPEAQLYDSEKNMLYVYEDGSYRLAKFADYESRMFDKYYKKVMGLVYTGWQNIDGKSYFYTKDHEAVTGDQIIGGVSYHFNSDGSLDTGSGVLGIDVSKYQPSINWSSVKASGVDFVIIRCGYRGASTGALIQDPYFTSHIKGAKSEGIKVGVYFFSTALNEAEAVEEASMCAALCGDYGINYPIFLDVESSSRPGYNSLSVSQRTENIRAFCQTIASAGYTPGLYANKNWLTEKIDTSDLSCKIWLAQYRAEGPTYEGHYDIWQYTSKGSVDGIDGRVDMNKSYLRY